MPWKKVRSFNKAEISKFNKAHRKKARFLVDENADNELASLIKELGFNAKYVDDVGLRGRTDKDVFTFACRDNRVIVTHDDDFMDNRQFSIQQSPGVVKIPGGSGDEEALINAIYQVIGMFGGKSDFYKSTKISISPKGVWTIHRFIKKIGKIETTLWKFPKNGGVMKWVET